MSQFSKGPFTAESIFKFFEEQAGIQFGDARTQRPILELIEDEGLKAHVSKSDFELWLEQQDESVRLEHEMGAL